MGGTDEILAGYPALCPASLREFAEIQAVSPKTTSRYLLVSSSL
jgi:hypothetical protein